MHGIPIIMQQCQQSLLRHSICYLSSLACCAMEKKHSGSIENSIFDGSHAALMIHGGKERQIILRIPKKLSDVFEVSNIIATYGILYIYTSETCSNNGILIAKINNSIF